MQLRKNLSAALEKVLTPACRHDGAAAVTPLATAARLHKQHANELCHRRTHGPTELPAYTWSGAVMVPVKHRKRAAPVDRPRDHKAQRFCSLSTPRTSSHGSAMPVKITFSLLTESRTLYDGAHQQDAWPLRRRLILSQATLGCS